MMDRARIAAFLDRFTAHVSGATTIALLAVADRSGLLTWLGENESGTVDGIAAGADLEPRYVREILSGLTAANVVDYNAETETFSLPPEHALFLVDENSPYFMGGWFDMVPILMAQIDGVAYATEHGGGVSFDEFGTAVIRGIDRGNAPSQKVFMTTRWLPAVPGLVDRLTAGIRVADVGCGSGTAAIRIAKEYPESQVIGFEVSEDSLEAARSRAEEVSNVSFETSTADSIPIEPSYDLITTFDVVHDLSDPLAGMSRIREALSPDGVYLMMEPNLSSHLENNLNSIGALMYGTSVMHCMTQSLAIGGEGVGAAWGREMIEDYANRAGFTDFEPLEDISNKFSAFYLLKP